MPELQLAAQEFPEESAHLKTSELPEVEAIETEKPPADLVPAVGQSGAQSCTHCEPLAM